MTAPRVRCAAAGLFRDKHLATVTRWTVTSPDGVERALCSAACVLEWICYTQPADAANSDGTGVPADADRPQPEHDGIPHARAGEVAA